MYVAKVAQKTYEETLSESRSGIPLTKEAFYETEKIISDAVRKGQRGYPLFFIYCGGHVIIR